MGSAFLAAASLIALSRVVVGLRVVAGAAVGVLAAVVVTRYGMPLVELAVHAQGSVVTDPVLARVRRSPIVGQPAAPPRPATSKRRSGHEVDTARGSSVEVVLLADSHT